MKNILKQNKILLLLLLFVWILGLVGCKAKQETQRTEKEIVIQNDTVFITQNQRVVDTLFVKIPEIISQKPECDSIANAEIQKLLKQLQTKKKSGSNEYGFYYDQYKKQLVAYAKLDSTFSVYKSNRIEKQHNTTEVKTIYRTEKYVPFWIKILAGIGALALIYVVWKLKK